MDQSTPQQTAPPDLKSIEVTRKQSELFSGECMRLIQETHKASKRMHHNDNIQLDQRVKDIQFLKRELELKLEEIIEEIDTLTAFQSRVVKALEACKEPLRVTTLCLEERINRPTTETRQDEVNRELQKEGDAAEGAATLLQRVVEQITEQIRLNQSAKYHLEEDLKEKYQAQCIDHTCTLMTINSIKNQLESKKTNSILPSSAVTPQQWENTSEMNIAKAERQKTNSLSLRAFAESVLEQTAADMQKQVQATKVAFQLNVNQIKSAKNQMEGQLSKILSEFSSIQRIREDLQVAITQKEEFLSLAQARVDLRHQRPDRERCHDPAQMQLLTEVQQLKAHISKLREAVAQSEEAQCALVRCQRELQEHINMKATSLYVDEVTCAQHRESIVIHNF
ncbi:tektin-1 [Hippoglossus hippoglossus]|uniref:tektin-1 n=1 Tax=Hippoglossus hippoglossus TaxID=8267 RepID=UPI00148DAEA1|nr:tektin-1 [Hippoglossus hippoglossus]XP_035009875.1 tektin-1 [Hippoglossus stenolepis]XP_035009876.1 tektin-1 [Hippoglossus stenolepis]